MKNLNRLLIAMLLLVAFSSTALAQSNPCGGKAMNPCNPCAKNTHYFHVADPMGRNSITFTSKAPLEDIVGTSREITGHIMFDPQNPQNGVHGELIVPVASFNTGIPLRDEHLQGKDWLDAASYPNIKLTIKSVKKVKEVKKTSEYQTYDLIIQGELFFHGQTKRIEIPGRFTFMKESDKTKMALPGDLLAARASFEIELDDYGVTGPKGAGIVGSKVGESIAIDVSFRASNADARMAGNPCNPCGGKAMNPCNPQSK